MGLCLVGVIIGEFLAANKGLGYLIIYGSQVFKNGYGGYVDCDTLYRIGSAVSGNYVSRKKDEIDNPYARRTACLSGMSS